VRNKKRFLKLLTKWYCSAAEQEMRMSVTYWLNFLFKETKFQSENYKPWSFTEHITA